MWELNSAVERDFHDRDCRPWYCLPMAVQIGPSIAAVGAAGHRQTLGRGLRVYASLRRVPGPSDACLSKGSSAGHPPVPWRNRYQRATTHRWHNGILRTTELTGPTKKVFSKRELSRTIRTAAKPRFGIGRVRPWKHWSYTFLWQAPPCRPPRQLPRSFDQVAGRTILPKVSFDIPRGTTLETFASRSVRIGNCEPAGVAEPSDRASLGGWNSIHHLALMPCVVTVAPTAWDREK